MTLTVEQRVLLHLWDTPLGDNPWEGRPELTQAGVSEAVGIARKHLPRTLKNFEKRTESMKKHVTWLEPSKGAAFILSVLRVEVQPVIWFKISTRVS